METLPIIAELDVPCDVFACLLPRGVDGTVHSLDFQRAIEALSQRIVIAYPGAADRMPEPVTPQRPDELGGRVIAAAVGVENRVLAERVIAGGHPDSPLDELGLVIIIRSPADHHLRMTVDDRRQVKPALPCRVTSQGCLVS